MRIVLGFSFGNRGREPGISNEAMAKAIQQFRANIILVQWEIGKALRKLGIVPHREISVHQKSRHYLDTEEVARQMTEFIQKENLIGEGIYVMAHNDHLPRCLRILKKKFGIEAIPIIAEIPYDPKCRQFWTRSRWLFRLHELTWPIFSKFFKDIRNNILYRLE